MVKFVAAGPELYIYSNDNTRFVVSYYLAQARVKCILVQA